MPATTPGWAVRSEAMIRLWYARLPRKLDPVAPRMARALADGAWTTVWREVAAWAPVAMLVLGFLVPWSWPGIGDVYTESLFFLGLAIAVGVLSGTLGLALLAGYVLREILIHDIASSLDALFLRGGSLLVGWLLLAVLVLLLPQLARALTESAVVRMRFLGNRDLRAVVRAILLAAVYSAFVWVWCQAMIVLVRPVFVWLNTSPTYEAVRHVQEDWPQLMAIAATAAVLRAVLAGIVAPRSRRAAMVPALKRQRNAHPRRAGLMWHGMPGFVRVAGAAAGMTLLLAGTFEGWFDAIIAGLAIALLAALGGGLFGLLTGLWAAWMARVPAAVRFVAAMGLGYLLTFQALKIGWAADSLRPVLIGILLTLTLLVVLFPAQRSFGSFTRRAAS